MKRCLTCKDRKMEEWEGDRDERRKREVSLMKGPMAPPDSGADPRQQVDSLVGSSALCAHLASVCSHSC